MAFSALTDSENFAILLEAKNKIEIQINESEPLVTGLEQATSEIDLNSPHAEKFDGSDGARKTTTATDSSDEIQPGGPEKFKDKTCED